MRKVDWIQKNRHFLKRKDGLTCSPGRTRTADKVVNSHLLYQLSYWGIALKKLEWYTWSFQRRQLFFSKNFCKQVLREVPRSIHLTTSIQDIFHRSWSPSYMFTGIESVWTNEYDSAMRQHIDFWIETNIQSITSIWFGIQTQRSWRILCHAFFGLFGLRCYVYVHLPSHTHIQPKHKSISGSQPSRHLLEGVQFLQLNLLEPV